VQDDTGDGSAGFEYNFAEVVSDKADFHALLHIATTLHKRVPNARTVGQDIHDSIKPDWILDGRGSPESILRARMVLNVPLTRRATSSASTVPATASFDHDRRFAASSGGVVEVASGA
jgi:hypothetical protein